MSNADLIGQQMTQGIPLFKASLLKAKASVSAASTPPSSLEAFKLGHKWTMTPAPEPEPKPVFQPLKLAQVPISLAPSATAAASTIRVLRSKTAYGRRQEAYRRASTSLVGYVWP